MSLRLNGVLAVGCLLAACSGCTTPSASFRGQSQEAWSTMPAGWSQSSGYETSYAPMSYGTPYIEDSGRGIRREQRQISRGLIPPPGSPYASGYTPTPAIGSETRPAHQVDGVNVYNSWGNGRVVGACPNGCPPDAACRNGAYDFTGGGCPYCGADYIRWMPTHRHTYSYQRPQNLTYPSPNSVGGAVVYSYYTLKGPSDFFRDEPRTY